MLFTEKKIIITQHNSVSVLRQCLVTSVKTEVLKLNN